MRKYVSFEESEILQKLNDKVFAPKIQKEYSLSFKDLKALCKKFGIRVPKKVSFVCVDCGKNVIVDRDIKVKRGRCKKCKKFYHQKKTFKSMLKSGYLRCKDWQSYKDFCKKMASKKALPNKDQVK
jgi:DNA-directed RNA polymerase subunit RPC12/RpoP